MATLILLNKPFDMLCQFRDNEGRRTLAECLHDPAYRDVYPAGRLDRDSEGLVLLTNNGPLQHRIAHPKHKEEKHYWVQVDGDISDEALQALRDGLELKDGVTLPARAERIEPPAVWDRDPPVRYRKTQPTSWLSLSIREGRNRQVRRMTAAAGFPTLRLIRYAVGDWHLDQDGQRLQPGEFRVLDVAAPPAAKKPNTQTRPRRRRSTPASSRRPRR